ncbi:MAG: PEGA domain-containing protein, partial [Myxococcales bacterium]|nr:PEGA domain-containing protein [Myxococcales bacterium]
LWVALGLVLVGGAGALYATGAWKMEAARPTIAQPLSHPTTAASPSKTELPAPTTPAVDNDGTLVVHVDIGNARIELDGALVAQSASGARVRVEPGEHTLLVAAPGRHRWATRVSIATGATVDVPVHLHHESEAAPATASAAPPPAAKPVEAKKRDKRNDPDYLVDPFSAGPK